MIGLIPTRLVSWAGLGLVLALLAPLAATAQTPAPLPASAFFDRPKMQQATLSPSGRWLGALTRVGEGRVGFLAIDLQTMRQQFVEPSTKDDINWFQWVNEDWIVFTVEDPTDRSNVYEMHGAGLMAMRRDGSDSRMIVARRFEDADSFRGRREFGPNHRLVGLGTPGTAEIVLVEYLDYDRQEKRYRQSHLKAFDLANATVRPAADNLPKATQWWLDGQGRPRVAGRMDGERVTYLWADKSGRWSEIATMPWMSQSFAPAYVEGDDQLVVTTTVGAGHLAMRRFDFQTGKPAAGEPLLATPGFSGDVKPLRLRGSGRVLGVHVSVDAATSAWFSPTLAKIQADVDAKLPGQVNLIQCAPCDGDPQAVLVHSYSAQDPGRFVLYRPPQRTWQQVAAVRPDIDPARMAALDFQRTRARDGEDLPVWITRPPQAPRDKALPAVVLVHGGPNVRGSDWRWDAPRQFLASRGYVVIEPEFRGSKGYGIRHERAGWKQWGQKMQDDVTDALRFAVNSGGVDASRVCIMGGSYGGYATLMGLVKDPDQYRCGVALAAVSDPRHLYEFHWSDIGELGTGVALPMTLGDPKADEAMLIANSPLVHADRIKAPLLLVHGGRDRRVPIQNGERMRDALRKLGKPVEWVLYEEEYHGFVHKTNELDFWRRVEAFLAEHLKAR